MTALAGMAAGPASAKTYPPPRLSLLCTAAANNGTLEGSVCALPSGQTTAPSSYSATIAVSKTGAAATAGDQGVPVLLVHGFPETWWAFRKLIPLLAARHRVYVVDLRGFGDSDVADENNSGAVAAEDLHALIEHLPVEAMHVVGQDVSGGVIYRLAATHPENVISLTAIESGLAGFGAEGLADVTHGGVWYIGALAAPRHSAASPRRK